MLKQISKIKLVLLKFLEEELITVVAVGLTMLSVWFVHAATQTTDLSFTILDVGTLTVTDPDGGEDWQVGSSQHITWTSTGSVASIKIELQRTVGGDWETLTSSTPNDGDYPWTTTAPSTATALVKITSTTVPSITDMSDAVFTISPSTITVASPNGGEDWEIGSSQHITWTTTGGVNNVKIELQRSVGGDWTTLVNSTTDDEDYPWLVTDPAATTATIKISDVDDPVVYDISDAVFIISEEELLGSPGGYVPTYPMIDSISPMNFYHQDATELIVRGLGFEERAWVTLNQVTFPVQKPHTQNIISLNLLPNTLAARTYRLCVYNSSWEYDCYRHLITVTDRTEITTPPTTGGEAGETYSAILVRQFSLKPANGAPLQTGQKLTGQLPGLTLNPREEATLWAEFKNTGTAAWYQDGPNPVRLGTDNKRDRSSAFYHSSWFKYNRPVLVNKVVKPGEIGRFEFTIKAPWTAKTYTEYFRPVAEWKTWMNGQSQVNWVITVKKVSLWNLIKRSLAPKVISAPSPTTPKSAVPSTGGTIETSFTPGPTLMFSDRIEQIYQNTIKLFNGFLTRIRK